MKHIYIFLSRIVLAVAILGTVNANAANLKTIATNSSVQTPVFTCVADGDDPCGCLIQNDDSSNPLMWYRYSSEKAYTFNAANTSFISDFNSGNGHCGYNDWRIPSIITNYDVVTQFGQSGLSGDFASLANYAHTHGYVYGSNLAEWLKQHEFALSNRNSQNQWYWSSNAYKPYPELSAWAASMGIGVVAPISNLNSVFVLPVRTSVGASWKNVGNPGFSAGEAYYTGIAFNPANNQPYVVYQDLANSKKVTVMRFEGTKWINVGNPGFSAGEANAIGIAFNPANNQPYVVYQDLANSGKATVMTFNGTNWVNVGKPGFSSSTVAHSDIAFNPKNNQPYVVYSDWFGDRGGAATAMTFDGTNWVYVGEIGFSSGWSAFTSIAFNPANNQPYVVYWDHTNSGKATVMTFGN